MNIVVLEKSICERSSQNQWTFTLGSDIGNDVDAYGVYASVLFVGILRNQNGSRRWRSLNGIAQLPSGKDEYSK